MFISILTLSLLLAACGGDSEEGTDDGGSDEGTGTEETESEDGEEEATGDFEEQTWRFITEEYQGEVQYVYAEEFANRIGEKTDGAITVEPYEFGALGSEEDQAQLIMQGGAELAVMSPGFTGGQVGDGQVFSLHYFFPPEPADTQEVLTNSEALNSDLRAKYEEHNISPLAFWTEGRMFWSSNNEITDPSDWEGLNQRVQASPLMQQTYDAYGASVQNISWGELYTALERGTVDAQENPVFFIYSADFYQVQDYIIDSRHNNYVAMTTVSTSWYEGLTGEEQQLIDETIEEMQDWIFEEQTRQNEDGVQAIQDDADYPTELIEYGEEEINAFREVAEPLHEQYRNGELTEQEIDPELFDKLQSEIEEVEGE